MSHKIVKVDNEGVTYPEKFLSAGINCGIKENELDLGIIMCEEDCYAAAVFTTNKVKAAPVKVSMESLKKTPIKRAIIVNSGNANCATGKRGIEDAKRMICEVSNQFDIPEEKILVCSTGVIGVNLPINLVTEGIKNLRNRLSRSVDDFSRAILTTDKYPKNSAYMAEGLFKIGGTAKGAGMIHPKMATMLAFICTDVEIEPTALKRMLTKSVSFTFNRISVDGDTSTNDTVIILSKKGKPLEERHYPLFEEALTMVCMDLAKMIVRDGEGATKVVKIEIKGAKSETEAERVARAVANSSLVKTAFFGEDPNWGRLMAAIGYSEAEIVEELVDIYIEEIKVVENGVSTGNEEIARESMKKQEFTITIDLKLGNASYYMLTSDLTYEYIKINASYRS